LGEPVRLYGCDVTHFELCLFIAPDTIVSGERLVDYSRLFLSELLLPGVAPVTLSTRRAVPGARMNRSPFSAARWDAAAAKIGEGRHGTVWIEAADGADPDRTISLAAHVNPPDGAELQTVGTIILTCSVRYLEALTAAPGRAEAVLQFGRAAWTGLGGHARYGFANLAHLPRAAPFVAGMSPADFPRRLELKGPPAVQPHPIPVAHTGHRIDGNLEQYYCGGQGIKGAFWANFLSSPYVQLAGGEQTLRAALPECRVETLAPGGLLIVAGESPLPEDTDANRARYQRLARALQPAFIAKQEVSPLQQDLLGAFYRERPARAREDD
jgi:hypothetical protein